MDEQAVGGEGEARQAFGVWPGYDLFGVILHGGRVRLGRLW